MSIELNDPIGDRVDYCDECGEEAGNCECDFAAIFAVEVNDTLAQFDRLAEVWGDEAVFRNCRDRLRAAVKLFAKRQGIDL